jgi:serine/threonine protein kinase
MAEEILIWATLLHENICPLLGVFERESELFFVYEYGENGTLREWRHTSSPSVSDVLGRVSLAMYCSSMIAAYIFLELLEVAKAIQHMHLSGIYLQRTIESVRT